MRKGILIAIISIIVVAGIVIYIFIPSPLTVSGVTGFHTSTNGAYRILANQQVWDTLAGSNFKIKQRLVNTVEIDVNQNGSTIPVSILLVPKNQDSLNIYWKSAFPATANPFKKITQYFNASTFNSNFRRVMENFQSFTSKTINVYGAEIIESSTKDTFLVATRFKTTSSPTIETVYSNIARLQSYVTNAGATAVSAPMLNISTVDSITYNCMVALPVNKIVEGNDDIFFVRMIPGRFLTTNVTGGPFAIQRAHRMMDQYFKDFNRISMAIPFEYLITNRLQEPDTARWITKIYCPVY